MSHVTKAICPNAVVVYNDFDNYRNRLDHIKDTNRILTGFCGVVADVPRGRMIPQRVKQEILSVMEREVANGRFVDYVTLSTSLLFAAKYATDMAGFRRDTLYNRIRLADYSCSGYLDGLTIVSCDYRELVAKYSGRKDACASLRRTFGFSAWDIWFFRSATFGFCDYIFICHCVFYA